MRENKFQELKNTGEIKHFNGNADQYFLSRKLYEKGNKAYLKNRYDKALVLLDKAIQNDSNYIDALLVRGSILENKDSVDFAKKDFEKVLSLEEQNYEGNIQLGDILTKEEAYKEAIELFDVAIRINPNGTAYWYRAYAQSLRSDYQACIDDYDKALRYSPDNAELISNRGDCRMRMGDIKGAEKDFQIAVQVEPNLWDATFNMGHVEFKKEKYDKAQLKFFSSMMINPARTDSYYMLARSMEMQENYAGAASFYGISIVFSGSSSNSFLKRGDMYLKLDSLDGAIKDYTSVIEIDSTDSRAMNKRAYAYIKDGKKDSARIDFIQAVELGDLDSIKLARKYCGKAKIDSLLDLDSVNVELIKQGVGKAMKYTSVKNRYNNFIFEMETETDSVKAELGAQFGLEYKVELINGLEGRDMETVWVYPAGAKDEEGKPITETKTTRWRSSGAEHSNYFTLEYPYEVVKGDWYFVLRIEGKEYLKQKFILY